MANVGCRIFPDFARPNRDLVDSFLDLPVANVDDCMNRSAAVDSQIRPFNADGAKLVGSAFTVKVPEGQPHVSQSDGYGQTR